MESDNSIRVRVRTGTSTRAPVLRNDEGYLPPIITFDIIFGIPDNSLLDIINNSLNDTEIKRNDRVNLNTDTIKIEKDTGETCCICQSEIRKGDIVSKIDCKHLHHKDCLGEWIKYIPKCPVCRTDIKTKIN